MRCVACTRISMIPSLLSWSTSQRLAPLFAPRRPQASQERHSSYGIEPRALIKFYWKSILRCLQHMPCVRHIRYGAKPVGLCSLM